jgi:hypothetical protein
MYFSNRMQTPLFFHLSEMMRMHMLTIIQMGVMIQRIQMIQINIQYSYMHIQCIQMQKHSKRRGPSGPRLLFRMYGIILVIQLTLGGLDLISRILLLHSMPLNHFHPDIFLVYSSGPQYYGEVVGYPFWESAMQEEYNSLLENQTWDLVPLPSGRKFVRCILVYRTKSTTYGQISRYKSMLVSKGFQ